MAVRTDHGKHGGVFFCTFTCYGWLPLIEQVNMYDWVYSWFRRLHDSGNDLVGYVIMPNHLHFLLRVPEGSSINMLVAEGKRFMAYEIIKRLKQQDEEATLRQLSSGIRSGEQDRGQKHRAFETSSDIKECLTEKFLMQKLDYIHANPIRGKWQLADHVADYPHSSAAFYLMDVQPVVPILHVGEV